MEGKRDRLVDGVKEGRESAALVASLWSFRETKGKEG